MPVSLSKSQDAIPVWFSDVNGDPVQMGTGASSQTVQGAGANGAAVTGNPILVAGSDETNSRTLRMRQSAATQGAITWRLAVTAEVTAWDGSASARVGGDVNGLYTQQGPLPAGTDRSGSATTASTITIPANAARRVLNIQNIGANNIGVNEFGGTAAIGTAGTYTLTPGSSMNVRTNRAITMIAATGATAFTATEY